MKSFYLTYPISELRSEVDERTSHIGLMVSQKSKEPMQEDLLRLSKGEATVFDSLLEESVADTYDWVRAFGKNFNDGVSIVRDITPKVIYKTPLALAFNTQREVVDEAASSVNIRSWSEFGPAAPGAPRTVRFDYYTTKFPTRKISSAHFYVVLTYRVSDQINGSPIYIQKSHMGFVEIDNSPVEEITTEAKTCNISFVPELTSIRGGDDYLYDKVVKVEIRDISVLENGKPVSIKEGDYVTYVNEKGGELSYIAAYDCTDRTFEPKKHKSTVGVTAQSVIFHLEEKDWWDENRRSAAKRYLKESMINRIIGKWFEMKFPEGADKYNEDAEDYGRKALLAMNAEENHLRRKTIWL